MPLYKSESWVAAYDTAVACIKKHKSWEQYVQWLSADKRMPKEEYNKLRAEYLINPNKDFYADH